MSGSSVVVSNLFRNAGNAASNRAACILWTLPIERGDEARVTMGWAATLQRGEIRWGSWDVYCRKIRQSRDHSSGVHVEEPRGVLYTSPLKHQSETNERLERLIADHMLVFTQRALFGQCTKPMENIGVDADWPAVDTLFVGGPTLPKYVGRLCYSLMNRAKSVVILAPEEGMYRLGSLGSRWKDEPSPTYCEDSCLRRWETETANASGRRFASFDLVIPAGDGLGGQQTDLPRGQTLWARKAKQVQSILASDGIEAKIREWAADDVIVPRVVQAAAAGAIVGRELREEGKTMTSGDVYDMARRQYTVQSTAQLVALQALREVKPGSDLKAAKMKRSASYAVSKAIEHLEGQLGSGVMRWGKGIE